MSTTTATSATTELDEAQTVLKSHSESFLEYLHEFTEKAEALIVAIINQLTPDSNGDSPEHTAWRLSQVLMDHMTDSDHLAIARRLLSERGSK